MSEIERFAASLNANWALRADAEQYEARANQSEPPLARMVAFAGRKGYRFSMAEARNYAKMRGEQLGFTISDADLDRVDRFPYAGGILGIITGDF